ncbi:hypothetical protein [Acinetobacter sp. WZC-1]|uniref:hypothetical protein n=1 Tax=Acinetobacter sp. WZC-1 TaxID=3459034 RepID=UPI00403DAB09
MKLIKILTLVVLSGVAVLLLVNGCSARSVKNEQQTMSAPPQGAVTSSSAIKNNVRADQRHSARLKGEDKNNDGIRDDIEEVIVTEFPDTKQRQVAFRGVRILQHVFDLPDEQIADQLKKYDCSVLPLTQSDQTLIRAMVFNTEDRKQVIRNAMAGYVPPVSVEIQIDANGNAIHPCRADMIAG